MAQGTIKATKRVAAKPVRGKGVVGAKWGARTVAPKRAQLAKNAKAAKVYRPSPPSHIQEAVGMEFG